MTCTNKVEFYVPRGWEANLRPVFVKCGNTDPWGGRTICHECRQDKGLMREFERHEKNIAADNAWLKSAGWGEM